MYGPTTRTKCVWAYYTHQVCRGLLHAPSVYEPTTRTKCVWAYYTHQVCRGLLHAPSVYEPTTRTKCVWAYYTHQVCRGLLHAPDLNNRLNRCKQNRDTCLYWPAVTYAHYALMYNRFVSVPKLVVWLCCLGRLPKWQFPCRYLTCMQNMMSVTSRHCSHVVISV